MLIKTLVSHIVWEPFRQQRHCVLITNSNVIFVALTKYEVIRFVSYLSLLLYLNIFLQFQEAQKCMRVKKLPLILALHLKRFKYVEQYNRHIKVSHRVVFPLELRLFNTVWQLSISSPVLFNFWLPLIQLWNGY